MLQLRTRTIAGVAIVALFALGAGAAFGAGANKGKGSPSKKSATSSLSKAKAQSKAENARENGGQGGDDFAAAVAYLGLTAAQVQADVTAGKTLAQIAAATPNKSTDGLIAALVAAEKIEIAAKVTAGTITQAQADAVLPTLTARFTAYANGTEGPRGGGGDKGHGGGGQSDEIDAAAAYLGGTTAELLTKLQAGQTLAQIAGATPTKTVAGLVAALVTAEKTELDAKVKAGKLTQAQEDAILPTLTATFTAFVNGTGGPHGADGPGGGHFGHHRR